MLAASCRARRSYSGGAPAASGPASGAAADVAVVAIGMAPSGIVAVVVVAGD
jgi:hypothetical protein